MRIEGLKLIVSSVLMTEMADMLFSTTGPCYRPKSELPSPPFLYPQALPSPLSRSNSKCRKFALSRRSSHCLGYPTGVSAKVAGSSSPPISLECRSDGVHRSIYSLGVGEYCHWLRGKEITSCQLWGSHFKSAQVPNKVTLPCRRCIQTRRSQMWRNSVISV